MGGFFGVVSKRDSVLDVFFGVDYHSHLGTSQGGLVFYDEQAGFQRQIHNIQNTPFRTKFENDCTKFEGTIGLGTISDTDPQPLLVRSHLGTFAIATVGIINNAEELVRRQFGTPGNQFMAMGSGRINSTELTAALINEQASLVDGIHYAQQVIDGTMNIAILQPDGIIAARDRVGRLPVHIGRSDDGMCVSFESFAGEKLGYAPEHELGPGEIVKITADGWEQLSPPGDKMRVCSFLWSYYGYPSSTYEGTNVEVMRVRNGQIMAEDELMRGTLPDIDYVAGVPDSGVPHAIGYAHASGVQYSRPFVKYTPTWPRSFMPETQDVRNQVAKMKQLPVRDLIRGQRLLFVDDSIVRGTQLRETVEFLYDNGAKEVHMRSACPPIMYPCRYLNFSRSNSEMELLARATVQKIEGDEGQEHLDEYADGTTERGKSLRRDICRKMGFDTLEYQTLDGLQKSIGIDPCKLCTYCWSGKD